MQEAADRAASTGSEVCRKEQKFFCSPTEMSLKVKIGHGNICGRREPRLPRAGWKTKKPNPNMMKYKFICFSPCPTSLLAQKNFFNVALAMGFCAKLRFLTNQLPQNTI